MFVTRFWFPKTKTFLKLWKYKTRNYVSFEIWVGGGLNIGGGGGRNISQYIISGGGGGGGLNIREGRNMCQYIITERGEGVLIYGGSEFLNI